MSRLAEAVVTLRLDKTKMARDLLGSRRMMLTSVKRMASMAKRTLSGIFSLRTLIGGGLGVMAFRRFVTPFAMFESEMDKSIAIMKGAVGLEEEMARAASKAAQRFGRSHTEMAQSFFFLASAGLDARKSLAVYNQMATFATAGSFDMAQATDMLTDSLSALGLASDDAQEYGRNMTRLSDLIVKGNTLANTSVSQLAEALMRKGATGIKLFGMEVEEGTATLLAMADKGFAKGAEAGTQFFIMLQALNQAWKIHKKEMKAAGIELFDQQGNFTGMANILESFNKHLGPLSTEARNEFISGTLAIGRRGAAVLSTLIGTSGAIREYTRELKDAGGITQEVADKNMGNLLTVWRRFKAQVVALTISFNKRLKPAYEELLHLIGAISKAISTVFSGDAGEGFSQFVQTIADALKSVRESIEGLGVFDIGRALFEGLKQYSMAMFNIFSEIARRMGRVFAVATAQNLSTLMPDWIGFQAPTPEELAGPSEIPMLKFMKDEFRDAGVAVAEFTKTLRKWLPFEQTLGANRRRELREGLQPNIDPFGLGIVRRPGVVAAQQLSQRGGFAPGKGVVNTFTLISGFLEDWDRSMAVLKKSQKTVAKKFPTVWEKAFPEDDVHDFAKEWDKQMAIQAAERGDDKTAWESMFGEKAPTPRAWQRSGIADMSKTIQDAIFGKHEEKIQEQIKKTNEQIAKAVGTPEGTLVKAVKEIDMNAIADTDFE